MANYYITIGGTGSRCLEALIYLSAAGLFTEDINVLLIDPDANNGNSTATNYLIADYYELHRAKQPENPQLNRGRLFSMLGKSITPPVLFKAKINNDGRNPARWNIVQQNSGRKFTNIIQYDSRPDKLKKFIDLFYHPDDREMSLEVGYQGRTNVGAVALKQDLEETAETPGIGLREFLESLARDLQRETKVFVIGSIFGGTGAAGIPTIPALIENLNPTFFPPEVRGNIRWGTALMAPYFSFPPPNNSNGATTGPGINSTIHPIAAKAALMHYADTPPGFQHLYLLGAPNRSSTNERNEPGGDQQRNAPHYIEMMSALAAWDFFNLSNVNRNDKRLHFADSYNNSSDWGISWETIPVFPVNVRAKRQEIKQKLVNLTTFAYVYHRNLHRSFIVNREYAGSPMYKDNFRGLSLDDDQQQQALETLNRFCENYLNWLSRIGATAGNPFPLLFNWDALNDNDPRRCAEAVGNLMRQGTLAQPETSAPKYSGGGGYAKILANLNQLKLQQPGTQSAVGLFIYLLSQAVNQFCKENYKW